MDALRRISRRAVRRARLRRFVRTAGVSLSITMGLALVLVLADRLVGPGIDGWLILAPAAVAALAFALLVATVLRPVGAVEATSEVDEAMRLKDRLSSALVLGEREPNDPFVEFAVEEATTLAGKVSVRKAIPVKGDAWWWTWPVLAAAALGIGIFVPQLGLLGDQKAEAARLQRIAQREAAASAIEQTTHDLEMTLEGEGESGVADPLAQEKLDKLNELRDQLTKGDKDADDARSEAAGVLGELADRFAQEAQQREMDGQAVRDLFQDLDAGERGDTQDAVDKLAEAMRRADAEGVKKAAGELEGAIEDMAPEERAATAERLRKLAEQLDELAKQAEERAAERKKQNEERLREQGMPASDAASMADRRDQEKLNQDLRDRGLDEENAQRLSEDIAEQNKQRDADEKAAERARDTSDALEDAARETEQPASPSPPGGAQPKGAQQDDASRENPQEQGPRSGQRKPDGADQEQPGQQQRQEPGQEGEQNQEREGQPGQRGEQGQEGQEGQAGEPREGEGESSRQREGSEGQQPQGGEPRSEGPGETQPEGAEPSPDGATPNAPEGTQQGERQSTQGESRPGEQQGTPDEGVGQPQQGERQPTPGESEGESGEGRAPSDQEAPAQPTPGSGAEGERAQEQGGEGRPGAEPGEPGASQGEQGTEPEGAQGAGASEEPDEAQGAGGSSQQPDAEKQPGPGGDQGSSAQKRNDPRGAPGADENASDSGAGAGDSKGLDQLRKQFEQMQKDQRDGELSKERADELRKQAEEMLNNMSPEERQRAARWQRDLMREQHREASAQDARDYDTEAVDARRQGAEGRVVGEMEAGEGAAPPDPSLVSTQEFAEQMAGSLQSAEKAMDERVVPTRYSNVERYFRQALERMQKQAAEQGAPAPEGPIESAEDVPAKSDGK